MTSTPGVWYLQMNGSLSVLPFIQRESSELFQLARRIFALYLVPLFFLLLSLTAEDEELCIIIICLLLSLMRACVRACEMVNVFTVTWLLQFPSVRTNSRRYEKICIKRPRNTQTKRDVIKKVMLFAKCDRNEVNDITLQGPPIGDPPLSAVRPPRVRRVSVTVPRWTPTTWAEIQPWSRPRHALAWPV